MSLDQIVKTELDRLKQEFGDKAGEITGFLDPVKETIVDNFGPNGLLAAYIALAALGVFLISLITKFTFATIKYLVIPAIALAFIGSMVSGHSFVGLLPLTVVGSSLILLVKG